MARHRALSSPIVASAVALLVGVLPSYAHWGIAASVLPVLLRLTQGLCLGGVLPRAVVYAVGTGCSYTARFSDRQPGGAFEFNGRTAIAPDANIRWGSINFKQRGYYSQRHPPQLVTSTNAW
jgi:hypothetical protein